MSKASYKRVNNRASTSVVLKLHAFVNASDPTPEIRPRATLALVHTTSGESCILNHLRKLGLRREFANRLHKVLIRLAVSRKQRAQDGDDGERVLVICPAQSN